MNVLSKLFSGRWSAWLAYLFVTLMAAPLLSAPAAAAAGTYLPGLQPGTPAPQLEPLPPLATHATSLIDVAPAGTALQTAAAPVNAQVKLAAVADRATLFLFDGDEDSADVSVFIAADLMGGAPRLTYAASSGASGTASMAAGYQVLHQFSLELTDGVDRPVTDWARPARLALDMRALAAQVEGNWHRFFLAYRDPIEPDVWHEVSLITADPAGIIVADVDHFSEWMAGVSAEKWQPSWTAPVVSEFSGAATFNYAIAVPAGRAGLQPTVSLQYNSRALDGLIRDPGSSGAVADGWSLLEVAVIRDGVKLASPWLGHVETVHPDRFRLVLGGVGYRLAPGGAGNDGGVRFYAEGAPGYYIERHDHDASDAITQRYFWVVKDPDGKHYRLGYSDDAESRQEVNDEAYLNLALDDGAVKVSGIAWQVDTVTDVHGNQIQYDYLQKELTDEFDTLTGQGDPSVFRLTTVQTRLWRIRYNFANRVPAGALPAGPTVPRVGGPVAHWLTFQALNGDDLSAGTYTDRIASIYLFDGDPVKPLTEYRLATQIDVVSGDPGPGACLNYGPLSNPPLQSRTTVVTAIQQWAGTDANPGTVDGLTARPATTFDYVSLPHYRQNGLGCFKFRYLANVDSGYGGVTNFGYQADERWVGRYWLDDLTLRWPVFGMSWVVSTVIEYDRGALLSQTQYSYDQPCYGQWASPLGETPAQRPFGAGVTCPGSEPEPPQHGRLVGFRETSRQLLDPGGAIAAWTETQFSQSGPQPGLATSQSQLSPSDGSVMALTASSYSSIPFGPGLSWLALRDVTKTLFEGGTTRVTGQHFSYSPELQGSAQYGNLVAVRDRGDLATATDDVTQVNCFFPNSSDGRWLVNRPAVQRLFAGDLPTIGAQHCSSRYRSGLLAETEFFYDNAGPDPRTPPVQGNMVQSRQGLPGSVLDGGVGGMMTVAQRDYDAFGNQVSETTPSGANTLVTYDQAWHLFPIAIQMSGSDVPVETVQHQRYGIAGASQLRNGLRMPLGALAGAIDANGLPSFYEYDPFGRLLAVYDNPFDLGQLDQIEDGDPVVRYGYWDNSWQGLVQPFAISEHRRPGSFPDTGDVASTAHVSVTYFDGRGRPVQSRTRYQAVAGAGVRDQVVLTAFDAVGRITCQSLPFAIPVNAGIVSDSCFERPGSTTTYDAAGRPAALTAPGSLTTRYFYGLAAGRAYVDVVDPAGRRFQQHFDGRGRLVSIIDISGNCGAYLGYPCGTDDEPWAPAGTTSYIYDQVGRLTALLDASGALTTMAYDALGRKIRLVEPNSGQWTYGYDAAGNLRRQTNGAGETLCFYHDARQRLIAKGLGTAGVCRDDGTNLVDPDWLASYIYGADPPALGQLIEVRWQPDGINNRMQFAYDGEGRLAAQTRWLDGYSYTRTTLSFDIFDRPVQVRYPDGEILSLEYDHEGVNSLRAGSDSIVKGLEFDDQSRLTRLDTGRNLINEWLFASPAQGNRLMRQYSRYSGRQQPGESATRLELAFTYDASGNIIQLNQFGRATTVTPGAASPLIDSQTFTYDHLGRLLRADGDHQIEDALDYVRIYKYDAVGNITQRMQAAGPEPLIFQYAYQNANQPHTLTAITVNSGLPPQSFAYDAAGRMTARHDLNGDYSQIFDDEGRLIAVTDLNDSSQTRFAYDADGVRVQVTAPTGRVTHYPFSDYEVENPGQTDEVRRTTYALQGMVIAIRLQSGSQSTLYFIHNDHLGSPRALSDANGRLVSGSAASYLPFGEVRQTAAVTADARGFTGRESSPELGLVQMGARYYVPAQGRFLTPDTLVANPGRSVAFNRYAYAGNNPVRFVDPTGFFSEEAIQDYIWSICGSSWVCFDQTLSRWQGNAEWWAMLRRAEAGDSLYGTYDPYGGTSHGGFRYTFLGAGQDRLDGISFAYAASSEVPPPARGLFDWRAVTLDHLERGTLTFADDSKINGTHILRLIWHGAFGRDGSIFIRPSTAIIQVSRVEVEYLAHLHGLRAGPSLSAALKAAVDDWITSSMRGLMCYGLPGICKPIVGTVIWIITEDEDYSVAIRSGPLRYEYIWMGDPVYGVGDDGNAYGHWIQKLGLSDIE